MTITSFFRNEYPSFPTSRDFPQGKPEICPDSSERGNGKSVRPERVEGLKERIFKLGDLLIAAASFDELRMSGTVILPRASYYYLSVFIL